MMNRIVTKRQNLSAFFHTTAPKLVDLQSNPAKVSPGYRNIISKDHPIYQPEKGRYHLYFSYACPWASRCLTLWKLKGLENIISVTSVHPTWQRTRPNLPDDKHVGWAFYNSSKREPVKNIDGYGRFAIDGCEEDPINGAQFIRDLYEKNNDQIKKYSVPLLWDKKTSTIVNNESSEIMRMFNSAFNEILATEEKGTETHPYRNHDFVPASLMREIEAINDLVYSNINDGVYKCGYAKTQSGYDKMIDNLYNALDQVEEILSKNRYLVGSHLTEADIRLFMTLVRFDEVYVVYFKCNKKILMHDYSNIRNYMREMYQLPGMAECVRMDHIKFFYFSSNPLLNPYAIVPKGPNVLEDMKKAHNRAEIN